MGEEWSERKASASSQTDESDPVDACIDVLGSPLTFEFGGLRAFIALIALIEPGVAFFECERMAVRRTPALRER